MTAEELKLIASELSQNNTKMDSKLNILIGYCENKQAEDECFIDLLTLLKELKEQTIIERKAIEKFREVAYNSCI